MTEARLCKHGLLDCLRCDWTHGMDRAEFADAAHRMRYGEGLRAAARERGQRRLDDIGGRMGCRPEYGLGLANMPGVTYWPPAEQMRAVAPRWELPARKPEPKMPGVMDVLALACWWSLALCALVLLLVGGAFDAWLATIMGYGMALVLCFVGVVRPWRPFVRTLEALQA